jgi:4-diphosphocytidyl-2-C-methyl-D-erythritol kinase
MRWLCAPAKINLSLRVIGRRSDGLHEIESLVAFADVYDWLGYEPGRGLELKLEGPSAPEIGRMENNLVVRGARALAARVPGLALGRFRLVKRLPVAAGIGGGSADAAAALLMLAGANGLSTQDERLRAAAAEVGADVPVCLFSRARMMSGVGDRLGPPVALPEVFALLVNPRVAAPTPDVFAALGLAPGSNLPVRREKILVAGSDAGITLESLASSRNDLEPAALRVAPAIGPALERLSRLPDVIASRISGSGATCFALFNTIASAAAARGRIAAEQPRWWVKLVSLR